MGHVAITVNGRYLRLDKGPEPRVRADSETLGPDTVFERLDLGHGRVAFRTADGRYLARRPDPGQNYGLYPEYQLTPAAAFEEILWPHDQVSLRSYDLTYVGAEADAPVTVNRTEPGHSERFSYVVVPVAMVPAQRTRSVAAVLTRARTRP